MDPLPTALNSHLQTWLAARRGARQGAADRSAALLYVWDREAQCLLVDYSGLLGTDCLHGVSSWEAGLVTLRYTRGQFEAGHVCDLWLPFQRDHGDPAFRQWFATLPDALVQTLETLPSRQYALAALAQRTEAVRDLIGSNVNLCFLLHWFAAKQGWPEARLSALAAGKQTAILNALGLPPYKRVLKLIRKIAIAELEESDLPGVLRVLRDEPLCDALVHEPCLPRRVFKILELYPWVAGRPLQRLLCAASNRTLREWVDDSLQMGGEAALRELCRFDRPSQIRRLHERLIAVQMGQVRHRLRRYASDGRALDFPPAPFPDSAAIQSIKTPDDLQTETEQMQHCVASYANRVYDGQYAVYRVLEPERLTLGLSLRHGRAALDQLKGVANQAPSAEAQAVVEQWLHEQLAL